MTEEYTGRKFMTVFAEKKTAGKAAADALVAASIRLANAGFLKGIPGNMSIRTKRGFAITAGGVNKEKLTPEDVVEILAYDPETETITAAGLKEPSSEARMHYIIYDRFPDVSAIVHVHDELALENQSETEKLGAAYTDKEEPYGTLELARQAVQALKKSQYIVMKNHGSISTGRTIEEAIDRTLDIHKRLEALISNKNR